VPDHKGVEPTNNFAERTIRHGVIWRKLSFGTDSLRGSHFVERMLTAVSTLRQQDRNVLEFITASLRANTEGRPGPSLLPAGTNVAQQAA
jgi:transposase